MEFQTMPYTNIFTKQMFKDFIDLKTIFSLARQRITGLHDQLREALYFPLLPVLFWTQFVHTISFTVILIQTVSPQPHNVTPYLSL